MSTASKLWLGFGFLLLFLIGIGLFVSHRLATIERALATIMAVQEPATATAYEMALNVTSTTATVLAYVDTSDPAHRMTVTTNELSFKNLFNRYHEVARSSGSRELGEQIRRAHDELGALADTLMDLSDLERRGAAQFERRATALRALVQSELRAPVDPRNRDAQRRQAELTRLEADLNGIGAAVGAYMIRRDNAMRERLGIFALDFRAALARIGDIRAGEVAGSSNLARLRAEFPPLLDVAREAMARADRVAAMRERFTADAADLEHLVDDGIHVLARTDLIDAQGLARHNIHVSIVAVLILLVAGVMIGGITALPVGRSIVRAERDLRERMRELAATDARKDEFLGVLGHELRNPLAPLSNSLHMLEARAASVSPEIRQVHAMMKRQVVAMTRLVDDLLDMSRISRGKINLQREKLRIGPLVAQTAEDLRPLAHQQGNSLAVVVPGEPLWVDADPTRLSQMVANLLNNAIKYTPPGGRIEISLRAEKGDVVVRVEDTGLGIPPPMLKSIFEPFIQVDPTLTRSHGGLGIGLTLVKRLAEMHGGSVTAESPGEDKGSTFTLRLPRVDAPASAAPAPAPAVAASPARRILVVDDNRDSAESMATLLRMWGHEVDLAFDGGEAIERAEEFRPEMVLLDIGLPGMDGYQVADRLRKEGPRELMLIALTGFGQQEDRERAFASGFDHHLTKPVNLTALQELLAGGNGEPVGMRADTQEDGRPGG